MNRLCMGCMEEYDDRLAFCPHCGYAYGSPPEEGYHMKPGSILRNRYIVGKALGFGGFGVTYIGWDFVIRRKVAIKEYLPGEFATRMPDRQHVTVYSGEKEEGFREGLEKMADEAKRLAQLGSIDGIVKVYEYFIENSTCYIVMEYLEGISLKEYLKLHGKMPVDQALPVILQIAEAMQQVHRAGILHRDIAPDNIYVLNPEEPDALRVKLLDFGAARYASGKHSKSLSVVIKQGYAPEEQYSSHGNQGAWSDVYALAATFYKMLTGVTPEDAMERRHQDHVKKPSRMGVEIPESVEIALMNAMRVRLENRTRTMGEFSQELLDADVQPHDDTPPRRKWFLILLTLTGAGAAAAVLTMVLMNLGIFAPRMDQSEVQLERNMVRVPYVINKNVEEAEKIVRQERLELVREKAVYSNEIAEGLICFQELRESTPVERYTPLVVWISKGEEKGILPFVKGLPLEDAKRLLEENGFSNIQIKESQEEGVYNSVLDVSEEQGTNVSLSKNLVITVCMNKNSREEARQAKVPGLVGLDRRAAQEALEEAGFLANWVEAYSEKPEGTVVRQDASAGTMANLGSYITLHVSKGEEQIYMENLQLMSQAEAEKRIQEQRLSLGTVRSQYDDSAPAGRVIGQSIAPGTQVKAGESVSLTVSKGKDPAKAAEESRQAEEAAAAEARRQAEEAAAAEARSGIRPGAEAAAAEASRQAEEAAAAEASRQAEEAAAAEASRQAEEAAAAEASRQAAEAAAAEASRQAEEAAGSLVLSAPGGAARSDSGNGAQANSGVVQEPQSGGDASGTVLASGRKTVSRRLNVQGKSLEYAMEKIDELDLILGSVREEYSSSVKAGYVISQSVSKKDSLPEGTVVNLVVSKGTETDAEE